MMDCPTRTVVPSVALALLVAAPGAAQLTITGVAETNLTASAAGGLPDLIPAGTVLTTNSVGASGSCGGAPSSSGLSVAISGTSVEFGTSASSFCSFGATAGGTILLTLSAPTVTRGSLHIDGGSSTGNYSVDVHADGKVELVSSVLNSTAEAAVPLVVGPPGIQVRVNCSSSAASGTFVTFVSAGVDISFEPDGIVAPEGTGCGPNLDAIYLETTGFFGNTERIDFDVNSSPVTPDAFFVFGTQQLAIAIPPLGCALRTNVVIAVPAAVDPQGRVDWGFALVSGLPPIDMRVQYLAAQSNPPAWRTSRALHFQLP